MARPKRTGALVGGIRNYIEDPAHPMTTLAAYRGLPIGSEGSSAPRRCRLTRVSSRANPENLGRPDRPGPSRLPVLDHCAGGHHARGWLFVMRWPRRRWLIPTAAVMVLTGCGSAAPVTTAPAARLEPCHGLHVARERFGWWSFSGERFSRAWICGHFGDPVRVLATREGILWSYGKGPRALRFLRHGDGSFSPT